MRLNIDLLAVDRMILSLAHGFNDAKTVVLFRSDGSCAWQLVCEWLVGIRN